MNYLYRLACGVICVGFDGTTLDPAFGQRLRETPLAGLILFGRNTHTLAQTRELTDAIRSRFQGASPIIAIDQEGGRVMRLREGVEEIPSMMALAATDDTELARSAGEQLGFDLRRAGVNVDFAPVLDLALFARNTVIGARSFGDDPMRVAQFAGSVASGLRAQGIVPTFKHFPGHGSTEVDSHLDLPVIELDAPTLRARDLVPFTQLLPHAEAVMTAHIVTQAFDSANAATVSSAVLTDVLRGEIHFPGVCFTDCMQMDAIAKSIGSAAGAVQAIAAGADCVLVSHDFDLALETAHALCDAVERGKISRERLEEAYNRVNDLRERLPSPIPLDTPAPHPGIGRAIGRRAIRVLRGDPAADAAQSLIISFEGTTSEGVEGTISDHAQLGGAQTMRLALEPQPEAVANAITQVRALQKRVIVLMRRAHVYSAQREAVEALLSAFPDLLLVSTREPYDALIFAQAERVLCSFGDDAPSMQGLADVIFGGRPARGIFPLRNLAR